MSTSGSTERYTPAQLGEFLNRMLEAERAGAKALVVFLDAFPRASGEWKILRQVQADEAHNCALIGKLLERGGSAYSHATGEFYAKAVAVSGNRPGRGQKHPLGQGRVPLLRHRLRRADRHEGRPRGGNTG